MKRQSWSCAACQVPNSSTLTECRSCKTPRTFTNEKPLEKNAVTESRIIYGFQAIILLFTIFLAKAITSSFFIGIAIVIVGWWAGLACFASQPLGGAFQRERQYIRQLLGEQTSVLGKRVVQGLFYGLYWPIFISKNVYFIFILIAGVTYYGAKYLYD